MENYMKKVKDFSHVTVESLKKSGARGLLEKYGNSPSKMLATLYPEYKNACREFVMKVVKEENLSCVEDVQKLPLPYQHVDDNKKNSNNNQ